MRFVVALLAGVLAATSARADVDTAVFSVLENWSLPVPNTGSIIVCHGYNCNFRTQVGFSKADHARFAALMAPGRASADAERRAIAETSAWFERRVAPEAGTFNAKARSGGGFSIARDPSQFDCIDTTANTTSLLVILDRLGLLRHHRVVTPISRMLTGGGPHFTAVIEEKGSGKRWTVDPWTHDNGKLPDVWPVERWSAGG